MRKFKELSRGEKIWLIGTLILGFLTVAFGIAAGSTNNLPADNIATNVLYDFTYIFALLSAVGIGAFLVHYCFFRPGGFNLLGRRVGEAAPLIDPEAAPVQPRPGNYSAMINDLSGHIDAEHLPGVMHQIMGLIMAGNYQTAMRNANLLWESITDESPLKDFAKRVADAISALMQASQAGQQQQIKTVKQRIVELEFAGLKQLIEHIQDPNNIKLETIQTEIVPQLRALRSGLKTFGQDIDLGVLCSSASQIANEIKNLLTLIQNDSDTLLEAAGRVLTSLQGLLDATSTTSTCPPGSVASQTTLPMRNGTFGSPSFQDVLPETPTADEGSDSDSDSDLELGV